MIAIIDYKAGNSPSVLHAVERLGYKGILTNKPEDIEKADCIILPGVGSARATMDSLNSLELLDPLEQAVINKKTPFLGICVGLQILFDHSEEDNAKCLGWLPGKVVKFDAKAVRVPQMGWNLVRFTQNRPCNEMDSYYYFVNSYYAIPESKDVVWGVSDYGVEFCAAVKKDNIYAAQFHVEKSGEAGLNLLNGFLRKNKGE